MHSFKQVTHTLWLGLFLVLSALPGQAAAADDALLGLSRNLLETINETSFGVGLLHQNYREFNNGLSPSIGEILDREDGNIGQFRFRTGGVYGKYVVQGTFDFAYGDTRYDGHTLVGSLPITATTRNNIFDLHFNAGYALFAGANGLLAPELELGYRSWRRNIVDSGQEETYGHTYLGVGLHGYYALSSRSVLELRYVRGHTINPSIQGTDVIYFGSNDLGSSPYTHAELGLDYRWGAVWHVGLHVDYMKWRYGRSNDFIAYSGPLTFVALEPDSLTSQTSYLLSFGRPW